MKYRVLIPSAGLGNRLEGFSKNVNKALVSISHKPGISYIIEKFNKNIEFVIAIGYKSDTVKEFLEITYPDRKFIFVQIDKYKGEGSGLGYTILKCKEHLQMPFIFISNDTIVLEDIKPPENNWMGYAETENNAEYRSVRIEKHNVVEICAKGAEGDVKAYIGLAGIYNYLEFWKAMEDGSNQGSIKIGESYGLRHLIKKDIEPIPFTWFDTGNIEALQNTRDYFRNNLEVNILEKEDEAIWFVNDRVIKFSIDKDFIKNRIERSKELKDFIPKIKSYTNNMYSYGKVNGEIFSKNPTITNFKFFLDWMTGFWVEKKITSEEKKKFFDTCNKFYKKKTYDRVEKYFATFEQIDTEEIINGRQIPKIFTLLEKVDWDILANGKPVRFHGDLHFENILINADGKTPFTLLDWRQDFGGLIEYGDIYYDFAKLNHGLIISHELVGKELFDVKHKLNRVHYDFLRKQNLVVSQMYFKEWIENNGYDYKKVKLLTALIFLNIAALHHYPYSLLLFYLGKDMLFNLTQNN